MKRMMAYLPTLFIVLGALLSACKLLIPVDDEQPITGEIGPAYSAREHQTRTFEALWKNIENSYVYFDSADVDWDALQEEYRAKIDSGLTADEFSALLKELEGELPEGSLIYQSRAERIQSDMTDTSTYEGIGAFIGFGAEEEPHIIILDVIEGSPAEKAGLRAHDSIFEIDGNPVLLEEGVRASERIRGPAGPSVTLQVKTPGKPGRSVDVERAKLTSTAELAVCNVTGTNYGYLLFPPNAAAMGARLRAGLDDLMTRHALIGDVRGLGLMLGLELVEDRRTKAPAKAATAAVLEATKEMGLLVGKGGIDSNVLRIKPPLCITAADVDFALDVLDRALTREEGGA